LISLFFNTLEAVGKIPFSDRRLAVCAIIMNNGMEPPFFFGLSTTDSTGNIEGSNSFEEIGTINACLFKQRITNSEKEG